MKNKIALTLLASFAFVAYFLISCEHVLPVTCETVNFSLTTVHTDVSNNQPNGSITATASGGTGFNYSINNGTPVSSGEFTDLAPGVYIITAHNSIQCSASDTVTIGGTFDPCANVNITIGITKVDATLGQSNGSITATANPAGNYTYSIDGTNFQGVGAFLNLAAGTYTITAKNSNGCTGTQQVTIGSVDPCSGVVITLTSTQVNPTTGQTNGSITATASPAGTYTYSLNGGAYQTSGTFSNLGAGSYSISAKNANGCTSAPIAVTLGGVDPCAGVTITITSTQVNPTSGSNGSITATASPAGTYTYSINGGAYQSSGTFNSLGAGTYTITAKNANGCLGSSNPISLVTSNPCTGVNITFTTAKVNITPCPVNNGSITVTASGSTGYTYSKNGGTSYQASNAFTGLTAGTYNIMVKDANGCTSATQAITLTTAAMGPNFTNVRTIIHSKCGNCHLNGGNTAGYNFDNDCSIVTYWNQIKGTCVQPYTRPQMPPAAPLTATQQSQITAWINAGHRYID